MIIVVIISNNRTWLAYLKGGLAFIYIGNNRYFNGGRSPPLRKSYFNFKISLR
jgi:hypothetical protein